MNTCLYACTLTYVFTSLCPFQLLTKYRFSLNLIQCYATAGSTRAKFSSVKKKIGWRGKFWGGRDKNNPQPVVSSDTDNRSCQSSDI